MIIILIILLSISESLSIFILVIDSIIISSSSESFLSSSLKNIIFNLFIFSLISLLSRFINLCLHFLHFSQKSFIQIWQCSLKSSWWSSHFKISSSSHSSIYSFFKSFISINDLPLSFWQHWTIKFWLISSICNFGVFLQLLHKKWSFIYEKCKNSSSIFYFLFKWSIII